jgi:hypothetical protein
METSFSPRAERLPETAKKRYNELVSILFFVMIAGVPLQKSQELLLSYRLK